MHFCRGLLLCRNAVGAFYGPCSRCILQFSAIFMFTFFVYSCWRKVFFWGGGVFCFCTMERAAAGIGLNVNAHKTEYMCYNQTGEIFILDGTPLELVDRFTYLGSSVASTEKDIDTRLTKAWTAINRLSIIWKSNLTDKMKRSFFQAAVTSILLYGCTTRDSNKTAGEEARRQLHKNAASNLEQVLAATPHKKPTVRPPASYHENYSS